MSEAQSYRPSNGTEGCAFIAAWCGKCERDRPHREDADASGCPILVDTMAYEIDDPSYPSEWVLDDSGPRCTAFVEAGGSLPYRCSSTIDMFGGAQ